MAKISPRLPSFFPVYLEGKVVDVGNVWQVELIGRLFRFRRQLPLYSSEGPSTGTLNRHQLKFDTRKQNKKLEPVNTAAASHTVAQPRSPELN